MIALILLILFGLGMAIFATQNTGMVHLIFGNYLISSIPLYVVVVGAMLLGIFVSWLISIVDTFSSAFTIHWKDSEIKKAHEKIDELKEENHNLELENARLGGESDSKTPEEEQDKNISSLKPSFTVL